MAIGYIRPKRMPIMETETAATVKEQARLSIGNFKSGYLKPK